MAIYRRPRPRWPLAVFSGLAGVVVGVAIGLLMGGDPDPAETALEVRTELRAAAGSVEVAAIEYEESVENGEVVNESEYRGALDALNSSRARFDEVRGVLEILAPGLEQSLDEAYAGAARLMEDLADPPEVGAALDQLSTQLRAE